MIPPLSKVDCQNSSSCLVPSTDYTETGCDEMNALDLLNEDCWEEVMKRVKDFADLKSCSETCLLFEKILEKKRNEFRFPLILPHILDYLSPPPLPGVYDSRLATWNALLNARLVCKSWCNSIDKLRDAYGGYAYDNLYLFDSGERTDRFLQKFGNHTGNPFFVRRVTLVLRSLLLFSWNQDEVPNVDPEETFHVRKLKQLLARFGKEIWNAQLFGQTLTGRLAFCMNMPTILGHLANLRTLELNFSNVDHELIDEVYQRMNMARLASYIDANPFPNLPQLVHLQAFGDDLSMMQPVLGKYGPNLKSLMIEDPRCFPEQAVIMSNLEELRLDMLEASKSLSYLRPLQAPRLRSLSLYVKENINALAVWPIEELFWNIQHLPIQQLRLHIQHTLNLFVGESGPIPAEERPYHGSISSLFLQFPTGSVSFNILLYCPKLMTITACQIGFGEPRGEIPANGVVPELLDVKELIGQPGSDLYHSNIWEQVPGLESLHYTYFTGLAVLAQRDDNCTRVEYEARKLGNGGEAVEEQ